MHETAGDDERDNEPDGRAGLISPLAKAFAAQSYPPPHSTANLMLHPFASSVLDGTTSLLASAKQRQQQRNEAASELFGHWRTSQRADGGLPLRTAMGPAKDKKQFANRSDETPSHP